MDIRNLTGKGWTVALLKLIAILDAATIFRTCFNPSEDTDGTINLQVGLERPLRPGRSRCGGRRAAVRQREITVGRASRVAEMPPASRQRIDAHRRCRLAVDDVLGFASRRLRMTACDHMVRTDAVAPDS